MKHLSFKLLFVLLLTLSLHLSAQNKNPQRYWDEVLDRYEKLCDACLQHQNSKEIKSYTASLQELLKSPVGKMSQEQQKRFSNIQKRYKGISEDVSEIASEPIHIIQIDTVRKVEHLTVVDTVFVKEILGEVDILQQMSRRDTIVHIISAQETVSPEPIRDTVYIERVNNAKVKKERNSSFYLLANAGVYQDLSYGALIGFGNKYGVYVKARDNFNHPKDIQQFYDGDKIWTSGKTDYCRTSITIGGYMPLYKWIYIYGGAGFGNYQLFWEDTNGKWFNVNSSQKKGLALDLGLLCHYQFLAISLGVNVTKFGYCDLDLGIGICF